MRFFFDNNLPPRLARAINSLLEPQAAVVHLTEKFAPGVPDVDWLTALGDEGEWVVISGDPRIIRNPHEPRAWRSARTTTCFLKNWMKYDLWLISSRLIRWWPDIMQQAQRVAPGAGFLVPFKFSGKFEQLRFD